MKILFLFAALFVAQIVTEIEAKKPVIVWHGWTDNSTGYLEVQMVKILEAAGFDAKSIRIGDDDKQDGYNGMWSPLIDQLDYVCKELKSDQKYADGYHAIGISQGGIMVRGLAETCDIPMDTMVTFGSPHMGTYGEFDKAPIDWLTMLVKVFHPYNPWLQRHVTPAQFFNDPTDQATYRRRSRYLAVINNEVSPFSTEETRKKMKENFLKLNKVLLIMFTEDQVVQPKESAHFGFYPIGKTFDPTVVVPVTDTDFYKNDQIGLKTLMDNNKVTFYKEPGLHVQIDYAWVSANILPQLA